MLLAGTPAPESVLTLAPGVSLVPLETRLTAFDLAAAGAAGFRGWALVEPIAAACSCEIESSADGAVLPGYDALNRAWLATALLVLRGFTGQMAVACSAYSWSVIAGHQERTAPLFREQLREEGAEAAVYRPRDERNLPPFKGNLLDFHLRLLQVEQEGDHSLEDEAHWIYEHFEAFNRLASESQAFRLALEAATDWRFAKEQRIAIGRLWAGIEALFGISSELVYRISLLSASLLEPRGMDRKLRFEGIKRLYSLRSKAVHGEAMKAEAVAEALAGSFELLRALLLLTVETGHVLGPDDFDQAVFC